MSRSNKIRGWCAQAQARRASRTHCGNGHLLTDATIRRERRGEYEIERCLVCDRARKREWARRKAQQRSESA